MKRRSPTLEGFKLLYRQSSLALAEIAWRWSFGAAAAALLGFSLLEYLDTLPVSKRDLLMLRSRQPGLVLRALSHILAGSGPRFMAAAIVLALTLAFAWVLVASLGRAATLKGLLNYFGGNGVDRAYPFRLRGLVGLNFLRAGALLAAVVGSVGAMVLGGMVSTAKDPSPGSAFLIFLTVTMLVWMAWGIVNWALSVASVYVACRNLDTLGALVAVVGLIGERAGAVFVSSTWFGLAHVVAFFVASSAVAVPLAFAGVLPGGVVLGGVLLVTLLYFAVADILYLGRLGAYVWIVEGPSIEPEPEVAPVVPPFIFEAPSGRVDPDDLILSDLPVT